MNEVHVFSKAWFDKFEACRQTWFCKKCRRFCPNCAGRSCAKCCVKQLDTGHLMLNKELEQFMIQGPHKDSLFEYRANQGRERWCRKEPDWGTGVAHPAELNLNPRPLKRPAWPWEQPRYKPNVQFTFTYTSPAQLPDWTEEKEMPPEPDYFEEVPPHSFHLTQYYRSTHPQYIVRY